jgi:hypothetical protein
MSHEILGGGTGSSQMGPWGMCRFWEGSWLDLIVRRQHPFECDGEILSEPPGAMMAGLLHHTEALMVYLQVGVPLVPDFHGADVSATKAANHALLRTAAGAGSSHVGLGFLTHGFSAAIAELGSFVSVTKTSKPRSLAHAGLSCTLR